MAPKRWARARDATPSSEGPLVPIEPEPRPSSSDALGSAPASEGTTCRPEPRPSRWSKAPGAEAGAPAASRHAQLARAAEEASHSASRAGLVAKVAGEGDAVQATVLGGEAFYLPEWLCDDRDRSQMDALLREFKGLIAPFRGRSLGLAGTQDILDRCPTYKAIVTKLAQRFNVRACYSIVNLYRNGADGIGAHTDAMAYGANMTIGASFGDARELVFEHKSTPQRFEWTQRNGDVFAFTDVANRAFRHSVPKTKDRIGPRLSIILWARQGGFVPVSLTTVAMPTQQEIEDAGGDWNRAQQSAQLRAERAEQAALADD